MPRAAAVKPRAETVIPPPTAAHSDAPTDAVAERYIPDVPLDLIDESPHNPRKRFDEAGLSHLAESIAAKGVLTPLLLRPRGKRFEIAAGHRRNRAARIAGRTAVPAVVRLMSDSELLEVLVIENDQREDVHPLEEAAGYQALLALPGYDVARIAARVSRSVKYVYDRLKLLNLLPPAQELFLAGRFTAGHAILLARLAPKDQERAIDPDGERALFTPETVDLFEEPDADEKIDADPYYDLKPRSVREFQAWVERNVRADRRQVDPVLFPETAALVSEAQAAGEKVIPIMHLTQRPEAAREGDKILSPSAWRRADGEKNSKTCDHAEVGVVEIGPEQYEAFRICRKRERCTVHWGDEIKARQARERAGAKAKAAGKDPVEAERGERTRQEQERRAAEARVHAERERIDRALPAVMKALAAAIRKAPSGGGTQLGKLVLARFEDSFYRGGMDRLGVDVVKAVPLGTRAEDLVRHLAFRVVAEEINDNDVNTQDLVKRARAFGVDAKAIIDQAAPAEKPKPAVQTSAKPGKPVKGTCRKCGCQELSPCAGGCGWADATQTRCTACFPPTLKSRGKKARR